MKKMHTYDKRSGYLKDLQESHVQMLQYAKDHGLKQEDIHLLERCVKADAMRRELLEKRKFGNAFKLILYADCFHSWKSLLVEPCMALKGK